MLFLAEPDLTKGALFAGATRDEAGCQPAKAPCPLLHKYRSKVAEGNACPLTSTRGILWTGARTLRPRRDSSPKGGNRESRSGTLGQRSRLGTALSHKGSSSPPMESAPAAATARHPADSSAAAAAAGLPRFLCWRPRRIPTEPSALAHGASG